jgi:hypothetical protein
VLAALAAVVWTVPAQSQEPLAVTVTDSVSHLPVPEAVARLLRARRLARADRLGRIRLGPVSRPDTLLVVGIGFLPETLLVAGDDSEVQVLLRRHPVTLSELTVSAARGDDLASAAVGSWTVPRAALAAVPPALESDPLRALVAVPGVTFSSPLSARPVVRGYDAAESLVRLDGFELINPYHIGRVFAAFPLDFTRNVDVAVTPHRATDAGTLAGVVDLVGVQSGAPQQLNGGADLSVASGTAWYGWRGPVQGFAGARVASLKFVTDLFGDGVGYDFRDGYARLRVPWPGGRWTDLTFYGSDDILGKRGATPGMGWTNLLLGQRTRLVDRTRWALDLTASVNRFSLDGREIEARRSKIDVRNQLERSHVGAEVRGWLGAMEWQAGLGLGRRLGTSEIGVVQGVDFAPRATRSRLTEFSGFALARVAVGAATLYAGGRVDASSHAVAWQPRLRVTMPLGQGVVAAVSYARATRLFQLVTDPQPEPTLTFQEFWLTAGDSAVPTPVVHHASAEVDVSGRWGTVQIAGYLSRGYGLGEIRPVVDQRDTSAFRWGESRTAGLEVRVARRPRTERGVAAVLSYALGWSQRRWEDRVWRPWLLDQRHRLRVQTEIPLTRRWRVVALAEARSAQPMTRVAEVFYRDPFRFPGDTTAPRFRLIQYLYAPEGSARGSGTFWVDIGTNVWFGGPGRSRITLGFAVTNVTFGPVAPLEPVSPGELIMPDGTYEPGGVRYHRRFGLPAVPSVTARVEF